LFVVGIAPLRMQSRDLIRAETELAQDLATDKSREARGAEAVAGRLFVLELSGNRIHAMNTDGSGRKTIVTGARLPDGVAVDVEAGHIFWTNMGVPSENDWRVTAIDAFNLRQ
jgi:hypothetical protein